MPRQHFGSEKPWVIKTAMLKQAFDDAETDLKKAKKKVEKAELALQETEAQLTELDATIETLTEALCATKTAAQKPFSPPEVGDDHPDIAPLIEARRQANRDKNEAKGDDELYELMKADWQQARAAVTEMREQIVAKAQAEYDAATDVTSLQEQLDEIKAKRVEAHKSVEAKKQALKAHSEKRVEAEQVYNIAKIDYDEQVRWNNLTPAERHAEIEAQKRKKAEARKRRAEQKKAERKQHQSPNRAEEPQPPPDPTPAPKPTIVEPEPEEQVVTEEMVDRQRRKLQSIRQAVQGNTRRLERLQSDLKDAENDNLNGTEVKLSRLRSSIEEAKKQIAGQERAHERETATLQDMESKLLDQSLVATPMPATLQAEATTDAPADAADAPLQPKPTPLSLVQPEQSTLSDEAHKALDDLVEVINDLNSMLDGASENAEHVTTALDMILLHLEDFDPSKLERMQKSARLAEKILRYDPAATRSAMSLMNEVLTIINEVTEDVSQSDSQNTVSAK